MARTLCSVHVSFDALIFVPLKITFIWQQQMQYCAKGRQFCGANILYRVFSMCTIDANDLWNFRTLKHGDDRQKYPI